MSASVTLYDEDEAWLSVPDRKGPPGALPPTPRDSDGVEEKRCRGHGWTPLEWGVTRGTGRQSLADRAVRIIAHAALLSRRPDEAVLAMQRRSALALGSGSCLEGSFN